MKKIREIETENNFSQDMNLYLDYENAITLFKEKKNEDSSFLFIKILNSYPITNNILKNRIIVDYMYVLKEYIKNNQDILIFKYIAISQYKLIKESVKRLKTIIKNPFHRSLYYEAKDLKDEFLNLLEPDIVMLNSNPLKTISKSTYNTNNQYYSLNQLRKIIKLPLRIKSCVLNYNNLNLAFNSKGRILIIQSDDFTENGDIILESERGESIKLLKEDFIKMISNKNIEYALIILCFPKSSLLTEVFETNIDYQNFITFENFNCFEKDDTIMKEYNKMSINFIIDFIIGVVNNRNNSIENLFETTKSKFLENIAEIKNEIKSENYIIYKRKKNTQLSFEYLDEIEERKVYLYDSFPKLKNYDEDCPHDYSSEIYNLIKYFNNEK